MRRIPPLVGWLAPLVIAALLPVQAAWAHAQFTGSEPGPDSILENSPHEIVLAFTQAVTPVSVTLVGPDGALVESVDDVLANGDRVVLPVTAPLDAGTHVVSFRVLSGDSHPISGGFRFSMASTAVAVEDPASSAGQGPVTSADSVPPISPAVTDPMPSDVPEKAIRVAFMLALLLAAGLVIFRLTISLPDSLDSWVLLLSRRIGGIGLILAIAYFMIATLTVTGVADFRPRHLYVVLQSSIGVSLLVAIVGFLFLSMSGRGERILGGLGAAILVASRVLTGHPASQEPMLLLVPAMAVHVATAAFWFASLWVLLRFLRKGPLAEAPQILSAFARVARWSVSALLLVGLAMAVIHLKSVNALLETDYGNLLLWKLGGVAGLLVLAIINKHWLTPDLLARFDARRLKTSIRIEALLMLLVIAASTLLAATSPVAHADASVAQSDSARVSVPSDTGSFTLQVAFSSAPYDETQPLSVELFDASGAPYTPLEVSVTVTIPSRRIEALPLTIVRQEGNHLVIETDFPNAPDTRFEARVLVTDFDRERFAFNREGPLE